MILTKIFVKIFVIIQHYQNSYIFIKKPLVLILVFKIFLINSILVLFILTLSVRLVDTIFDFKHQAYKLGRRQVVRHQVLILAFGGSNPSAPAKSYLVDCSIGFLPYISHYR
jgi:hypothetical protein